MVFYRGNKERLGTKHKQETINKMRRSDVWSNIDEAKRLYLEGKTCREIGEILKINHITLGKGLKRIGVKMRMSKPRKGNIAWNKGKRYLAITGDKNPNWKGGISGIRDEIRHCLEYKQWRKEVFERDNYTCKKCNKRGGELEIHHNIKTFSEILISNNIKSTEDAILCNEFWNIDNGITLCLNCHNKTKGNNSNKMTNRA